VTVKKDSVLGLLIDHIISRSPSLTIRKSHNCHWYLITIGFVLASVSVISSLIDVICSVIFSVINSLSLKLKDFGLKWFVRICQHREYVFRLIQVADIITIESNKSGWRFHHESRCK
jgi:hypothetical protein